MINKNIKTLFLIILLIFFITIIGLTWINFSTNSYVYSNYKELPYNRVGLIPGCNKYVANGVINEYYTQRIDAGVKLFNSGKIDYILVSGDNAHVSYDEPRQMKASLVEAGVPKDKIYSDYAGFRTLDTTVRAKEVFKLNKLTFISQSFQNQRGVFIGRHIGMDIVAFNADYSEKTLNLKTEIREIFAKIKMLIDIYIIYKEPKFLGDEIIIGS